MTYEQPVERAERLRSPVSNHEPRNSSADPLDRLKTAAERVRRPSREDAELAVRTLIEYLEDDPSRDGLKDTPRRVVRMYDELRDMAQEDLSLTSFPTSRHDDLVVVRDVPFASLCEHHIAVVTGTATIGYLVDSNLLGLSKFARVVRKCASGLTVQENLTHDIATSIAAAAASPSVAVVTKAVHSCMYARGARTFGSETLASVMLGEFRADAALRAEFLQLVTL